MKPGEYIRACREKANLTLREVAESIDISIPYLSDVERGKRYVPRAPSLRREICHAVGADISEVDRLEAREEGTINMRDLTPAERERVFAVVASIRASRAT